MASQRGKKEVMLENEQDKLHQRLSEDWVSYKTHDNIMEGFQIIGFDWRYLYVNNAAAKHGRRSKEELLGHTMMEAYPGVEKTEVFSKIKQCMEERLPCTMENKFSFPDGSQRWFELYIEQIPEGVFVLSLDITERKVAEEALRKSEEAYRELFDTITSGVAVYEVVDDGSDFVFKDVNRAGEKMDGVKKVSIIGKRVTDVFPGVKDFGLFEVFQRVWRTGKSEHVPAAVYKDKRLADRWREDWVYKLPDGDIVSIYNDITERKRAVDNIEHLNRILRSIRNVNLLIVSEDNPQILVDKTCESLVESRGYRSAMIVLTDESGRPYSCTGGKVSESFSLLRAYALQGKLVPCCEIANRREGIYQVKDRSKVCGQCPVTLEGYPDNVLVIQLRHAGIGYGYLVVSLDRRLEVGREEKSILAELAGDIALGLHKISLEAKKVEMQAALKESEEKYRDLYDNAPIAYYSVGPDALIRESNKAACSMLGYSRGEMEKKYVFDIYAEESRDKAKAIFSDTFKNALPVSEEEMVYLRKDGRKIYGLISATPLKDDRGRVIANRSVVQDITERKRMEESLINESARRRVLIEYSRDGIVILDQEGKVYEANRRFADMLSYLPEEVPNLHVWDWDKLFTRERLLEMIQEVGEAGVSFETRHTRKDGTVYDVELSNNGVTFDGQKFVFCVVRDITERKKAEEEIRNFAKFPGENPNPVLRIGKDGLVLHANKAASPILDTLGTAVGEPINRDWRELADAAMASGKTKTTELNYQGRTFSFLLVPIVDSGYVNIYGDDITERKQAEGILKESEERYRTFIQSTHEIIQSVDANGRFLFVNKAWHETLGYSKKDLKYITLFDIIHPDCLEHCGEVFQKVMSGKPATQIEVTFKTKDGSVIYAEGNATPRVLNGRTIATQGFFRNIT